VPLWCLTATDTRTVMSEFNKTPRLVLLPAVDVAGGKAVRLTKPTRRRKSIRAL